MSDPKHGKVYVPIDFRNLKKGHEPFILRIDEDEEPPSVTFELFDAQAHVAITMDERALDILFDAILKNRIELMKMIAYRRGAASAMRKKK